ncbi:hypothetical protein JOL62DRAFT_557257 [Phyllosticta paracitricarpa]|uniref:DUF202 domain-containing protein n=2 Tax=Phyllosticta TaxID=121621 RepID=A0ABR1N7G1_9PEZI
METNAAAADLETEAGGAEELAKSTNCSSLHCPQASGGVAGGDCRAEHKEGKDSTAFFRTTNTTTAASGISLSSSSSNARESKDEGKEYEDGSEPKDKGKRRADDDFIDAGPCNHEKRPPPEDLDDTKLSNPNLREATELAALPPFSSSSSSSATGAASRLSQRRTHGSGNEPGDGGGDALSQTRSGAGSGSGSMRSTLTGPLWWQAVQRWWKRHVSVTVEVKGMRDHLALERTFLGYLRTSIALSMTGVILAQLFRLQHSLHPDAHLGFYVLGIPLASTFIGCAIAVALLGAFRFWRQQSAIIRGKVLAGGWEMLVIMIGSLLVCLVLLVLVALA